MFLQSTLKSRWQITSPSFLYFKTVQYSIIEKTKLLTWSVQAAIASKNPRKPWQKNCTVLLDHYETAPTVTLLLLQYSQVQRDSQHTGAGRKEPVCIQEKCHFTGIKRQCVICTVMKMEPYVLWMHTFSIELTIPGTGHCHFVWQVTLAVSLF